MLLRPRGNELWRKGCSCRRSYSHRGSSHCQREGSKSEGQARNSLARVSLLSHSSLLLVPPLGDRQRGAGHRESPGRRPGERPADTERQGRVENG